MSKKVVVFGCDNSGKTTLCNQIKQSIPNSEIVKSLGPAEVAKQVNFMREYLFGDVGKKSDVIVFDRFPIIEECVCGPIFRGKNNFLTPPWDAVFDWLQYIDLFVYCRPSIDSILNWGEREQMSGVKSNAYKLIEAYDKLFFTGYPYVSLPDDRLKIKYNWEKDSPQKVIDIILEAQK